MLLLWLSEESMESEYGARSPLSRARQMHLPAIFGHQQPFSYERPTRLDSMGQTAGPTDGDQSCDSGVEGLTAENFGFWNLVA